MVTLPETNSEFTPENGWLEDQIFCWEGLSSGAMLVFGSIITMVSICVYEVGLFSLRKGDTVDGSEFWETHQLSLGIWCILPLFAGFHTFQVVVWDFFH